MSWREFVASQQSQKRVEAIAGLGSEALTRVVELIWKFGQEKGVVEWDDMQFRTLIYTLQHNLVSCPPIQELLWELAGQKINDNIVYLALEVLKALGNEGRIPEDKLLAVLTDEEFFIHAREALFTSYRASKGCKRTHCSIE